MMQVEFYNHGCKAFFKKYGSRRKAIVKAITRLAFSVSGERVVVYFITTNLQKAVFSTAFEHLIGSIRKQYAAGSK